MNLLAKYPLTEDLEFQKNLSSNFKIWVLRFKKNKPKWKLKFD